MFAVSKKVRNGIVAGAITGILSGGSLGTAVLIGAVTFSAAATAEDFKYCIAQSPSNLDVKITNTCPFTVTVQYQHFVNGKLFDMQGWTLGATGYAILRRTGCSVLDGCSHSWNLASVTKG